MEYRKSTHANLDNIEFTLLEELLKLRVLNSLISEEDNQNRTDILNKIYNRLGRVVEVSSVLEVIYKIDDGFIGIINNSYDKYILIQDYSDAEVGDIYFLHSGGYGDNPYIVKVGEELIDDKKSEIFFKEMDDWVEKGGTDNWNRRILRYDRDLVDLSEIDGKEINFKIITEKFEEHKKKKAEEKKVQEFNVKVQKEEDEEIEATEKEDYDNKGEISIGGISIEGNIIKDSSTEYILDKDVNKIFPYDRIKTIKNSSYNNTILPRHESFLNDGQTNYTKKYLNTKRKGYNVTYKNDKCKINGVNIPSVKIKFILNRIYYKDMTDEGIKVLIKLNGMKADFINLESIGWRLNEINIPIINKAIDDKTFEIEFLGKTKIFDWGEVKKWFFASGGSRSVYSNFSNSKLSDFSTEMGVGREELFKTLKRIKMLDALKDEDED